VRNRTTPKFEVYERLAVKVDRDGNGDETIDRSEPYASKSNAKRAAENVEATAPQAEIPSS